MKDPVKLQAKRIKAEAKLETKIQAAHDKAAKKIAAIQRELEEEETLLREDFELMRSKIEGKLAAVDAAVQAGSVVKLKPRSKRVRSDETGARTKSVKGRSAVAANSARR